MRLNRRLLLSAGILYLLLAAGIGLLERGRGTATVEQTVQAAVQGVSLDTKLAPTPPMGYNGWNAVRCKVSEGLIERTARAMVGRGLAAAGYRYVNIDDCWSARSRDRGGHLRADPRRFPHGIHRLARYVHSFGLKLGIYADAGTSTCAGYPGSYGHEARDAKTFASWGVDYLKEDWCHIPYPAFPAHTHDQVAELLATRMAEALHATGRPIVLSLSNASDGTLHMWRWGRRVAELWRTTPSITDTWDSVLSILDENARQARAAGPGHWNDPDMLEVGNGRMTPAEDRAHFSLWSVMAAPLLIGTNVTGMPATTRAILTNRAVIAVDQDTLGVQGTVVQRSGNREVLMKPLANGDRAIVLLNRGAQATTIRVSVAALGLRSGRRYTVRDLWTGRRFVTTGSVVARVPPRAAVMLRIH